jgi:hypothetical protein
LSALAGACSGGSSGNGTGGSSGPGAAGTTGNAGSGSGAAGTTGNAGSSATAGTTGNAGSSATAGTTGNAGSSATAGTTGNAGSSATAGSTGSAGSSATAGTTGNAGRGGSTGSGGVAGSTAGSGGAAGAGGTVPPLGPDGAPPACQSPIPITMGTAATVTATLGTTVHASVSTDLMGVHTSVYDSNMQLPSTPEYLKAAGVKSLRYPGGSYSDLYHWSLHTGTYTPAAGAGSNTIFIAPDTHFGAFLLFMERVGASALITVNYGMNSVANGGGEAKEAAAWVAYANGSTTSTVNIGADSKGTDWRNVAFWATLRSSAPLATDDGYNRFRISHPAPFNIKYWEVGNELYGNGWYYGGCGWEADMHVAYPASGVCPAAPCNYMTDPACRYQNPALSPARYGAAVRAYAQAMKLVDSTIKVGGVVVAHSATEYTDWNGMVLPQACGTNGMDFASVHWYPGMGPTTLLNIPETEIPMVFSRARSAIGAVSACAGAGGANMPIAITEWGPNTLCTNCALPASTATAAPVGSQLVGLFAAESYARFMEQGALAVHWLELHNNSYLAGIDATNDPFTTMQDTPRWGYHGAQIAHFLAGPGDRMVQAAQSGTFGSALKVHASVHVNNDIAVMMTNTNRNVDANVTLNVSGGTLACVGKRYAYTPVNTDQDGGLRGDWIFSNTAGTSVPVLVPRYSSVVVLFPRR